MAGPSKRVRLCDPDYEETVTKWYNEDYSDDSDVDHILEDHHIEPEHDTDTEVSAVDSDKSKDDGDHRATQINEQSYMYGKNRYRWSATEVRPSSRTRKHNIVMKIPSLSAKARNLGETSDHISVWNLLLSDNILEHIVVCTNKKISTLRLKYKEQNKIELQDVDVIELKAFLGLLIYTSVFNSNHENLKTLFATDGTGREIFRCAMSIKRISILLCALRFDNAEDREGRKESDPVAAISFVSNSFVENCQLVYITPVL